MVLDRIEERDAELLAAYKRIRRATNCTHAEACEKAVNSPASRYWVGTTYIYRELLRRSRNRTIKQDPYFRGQSHRKDRLKVYDDLWERYNKLKVLREFRFCSTLFMASFVVNCQAPNFCISVSVGKKVIERELRKAHEAAKERRKILNTQKNGE